MLVLDPMMGSGIAARVARSLGRKFVGYDINREYVDLATLMVADVQFQMDLIAEEQITSQKQLELLEDWDRAGHADVRVTRGARIQGLGVR